MKLTFNADPVLGQGERVNLEREGLTSRLVFDNSCEADLPNQKSRRKRLRLRDTNLLGKFGRNVQLVMSRQ
ncbi:hypothetical protein FB106_11378 [Synechococcus sp. Ace-Pa]|uniref:hypothetical protein n=1 Tax=Candidatus Regnicoccus frigidus TaxID=3074015 RepID=UPI0008FF101E|nr:hypothetical protein [Candidatus Regnicoccus frigidus]APD47697.1 hypothetical protein BM449_04720 [Synechococcus sp. SynAce01]MCT0247311.1 hypothetical protein [Synechococcus sp. CS-601]MCT4366048.1 hypothetical protein [Candidatus Regnicoccus frigidus MAG-AL2]TWB89283.1 hypothetical protein FB106_11378 [Synechococcus sp. Ace-Pa]